jgi:hypothetical protein
LPVLLSPPIINQRGLRVRTLAGAPVFNTPLLFSFLPKLCKSGHISPQGNIFGARPGGLSVIALDGTLETGQPTFNVAWGEDGQTSLHHWRLIGLSSLLDYIRGSVLACIINEHFCCNRGLAAATSFRQAGSPLAPRRTV